MHSQDLTILIIIGKKMNKKYFIILIAIISIAVSTLYAADEKSVTPAQTKQTAAGSVKEYVLGVKYGYGASYPSGEIAGDGGQKALYGEAKSFGLEFGHLISQSGWLSLSLLKTNRELVVERTNAGQQERVYIYTGFIDIALTGRYIIDWFYADLGIYYGLHYGSWFKKVSGNGVPVDETPIYGSKKKNEFGANLGTGFLLPVNENVNLQLGLLYTMAFTASYQDGKDKLKPYTLEFISGVQYKI
jgi:hypothetical protein